MSSFTSAHIVLSVNVLDCPACGLDLSPTKNIWHIKKKKNQTKTSSKPNL